MTMGRKRRCLESQATLLVLLTILSCDTFKEDFIGGKQVIFKTEYYVLPSSSLVIDLESAVKQSYTNGSITISQNPSRGTLSQLGTLLLKYYPAREFLEGQDQFVFSVVSNNEVIATETIKIFMKQDVEELPCPLYAVEDKVHVRSGSSVSVKLLKNDRICGIGESPLQISIYLNPRFGESKVVGDSIIVYTAGPGYTGRDELVYKISDSSGENVSYGIVSISEWKAQIFPTPITPMRGRINARPDVDEMFFINDRTGFLGGYGIYKTTDGGATWKVSYPVSVDNPFEVSDIYFLDADRGYACFVRCEGCGYEGGLLRTADGGDTWEMTDFLEPVASVYFTSSTTGFVNTIGRGDDSGTPQSIQKTDDGGKTWKQVFHTTDRKWGWLKIRFVDSKNGYAFSSYAMFKTVDGGESWNLAYENVNEFIKAVVVMPENIISANFSESKSDGCGCDAVLIGPSTMFRSLDGEAWSPAKDLPYIISAQGYSPGGNIGFAIGVSAINPSFDYPSSQTLSLNKSGDKGATWTEVEVTERLAGHPLAMDVPSDTVAYILSHREIIKFTRP